MSKTYSPPTIVSTRKKITYIRSKTANEGGENTAANRTRAQEGYQNGLATGGVPRRGCRTRSQPMHSAAAAQTSL